MIEVAVILSGVVGHWPDFFLRMIYYHPAPGSLADF